jgi:hypothetical protein
MNTDNVLEQYRREIINQTVQDLLEKFTSLMSTSLAVLNGRKVNPDEWVEEIGEEIRGQPKPEKVFVKMVTRKKIARKSCPVKGCKNVFAPRFGGFCNDHRTSSGYRAWRTRKTASEFVTVTKAKLKKAAKKR